MPFSGTELLEVCSPNPTGFGAVVGNYIVIPDVGLSSGTHVLPNTGTFTVMNTSTGDARVFTGLPTSVATGHPTRCASDGSYAWFVPGTSGNLFRINPATGVVDTPISLSGIYVSRYGLVFVGSKLWMFRNSGNHSIFDFGTSTWTDSVSSAPGGAALVSGVKVAGDLIVLATMATLTESGEYAEGTTRVYDEVGVQLATIAPSSGSGRGGGAAIDTKAYFPRPGGTNIDVIETTSMTGTTLNIAPYYCGDNLAVGDDGWIYTYDYTTSGGAIVAVSPVTGNVQAAAAATARDYRTLIYNANGSLWIPSGDPRT